MNEQLQRLRALQATETQLREALRERERFPALLAEARKPLEAAQDALQNLEARLKELQTRRRNRERDLDVALEKVRRMKDRTSEIKTNKEYFAHLKEIETAQKSCAALEEEILQMMEEQERMAGILQDAQAKVREEQSRFTQTQQRLQAQTEEADRRIATLKQERQARLESLDPVWRQQYERLLPVTKGLVVVEAQQGTCTGCRMNLPPQVYNDVRKNEGIVTCPHCHRVLYVSEPSVADDPARVSNPKCV